MTGFGKITAPSHFGKHCTRLLYLCGVVAFVTLGLKYWNRATALCASLIGHRMAEQREKLRNEWMCMSECACVWMYVVYVCVCVCACACPCVSVFVWGPRAGCLAGLKSLLVLGSFRIFLSLDFFLTLFS